MTEPVSAGLGTPPLHAVWWQVLKPRPIVMANGQPAMDIVHSCETLAEASIHANRITGGAIVMCAIVHVNVPPPPQSLVKPS